MYRAYRYPIVIFFVLPNILVLVLFSYAFFKIVLSSILFMASMLGLGFFLAPVFGPRVDTNKLWSFVLALVCIAVSLAIYFNRSFLPK